LGSEGSKLIKVNQLGSFVSESVGGYHYGEKNLYDTINRMVLDYPGSNNLPHFVRGGQFGTRNENGDDTGDGRYVKTKPQWWWEYQYTPEDDKILTFVQDEGEYHEPIVYLPVVIPLFNGFLGIGTSRSTSCPNFNFLDLIEAIRCLIAGSELPELIPYYVGYTGTVSLEHKSKKAARSQIPIDLSKIFPSLDKSTSTETPPKELEGDKEEEDEDAKEERLNSNIDLSKIVTNTEGDIVTEDGVVISDDDVLSDKPLKVVTRGVVKIISDKILHITELPIGLSIKQMLIKLDKLKENKEIKDYKNLSKKNVAKFEIIGYGKYNTVEELGLVRCFSLTNIVLLDENSKPIKFKDQYDLVKKWYEWRLPYYASRKQYMLNEIKDEIIKNT
jgi:DNA gyrase/topoisomerase IV subunit A